MSLQVYTLHEGSYSVDATKKFVPFDPEIHQAKDRPASLFIHVQPFLVKLNDSLIKYLLYQFQKHFSTNLINL
mgnify:CR=1 FL=1